MTESPPPRTWPTRRLMVVAGLALALVLVAVAIAISSGPDSDRTGSTNSTSAVPPDSSTTGSTSTTAATSTSSTSIVAPTVSVTPPPASSTGPPSTVSPTTVAPGEAVVIWRGDPARRVVTLTFDAGSDVGNTDRILDILRTEGITATFGITGDFADRYPDQVRRIAAAGHQLVNHTADHRSFTGFSTGTRPLSAAERADQLRRAESSIRSATGGTGTAGWFRPPYGDLDGGVERDVATAGWPTVLMWTVDSLGWKGIPADDVVARCLGKAEAGAIFLFHVGSASSDADALPRIVAGLRADGYAFASAATLPR